MTKKIIYELSTEEEIACEKIRLLKEDLSMLNNKESRIQKDKGLLILKLIQAREDLCDISE